MVKENLDEYWKTSKFSLGYLLNELIGMVSFNVFKSCVY